MYFQANVVFKDKIQENANGERVRELLKEALRLLIKNDKDFDVNEFIKETV